MPVLLSFGTVTTMSSMILSRHPSLNPSLRPAAPLNFSSAAVDGGSSPDITWTMHLPHAPVPPQMLFISTPSALAASSTVVLSGNLPLFPSGWKTISWLGGISTILGPR